MIAGFPLDAQKSSAPFWACDWPHPFLLGWTSLFILIGQPGRDMWNVHFFFVLGGALCSLYLPLSVNPGPPVARWQRALPGRALKCHLWGLRVRGLRGQLHSRTLGLWGHLRALPVIRLPPFAARVRASTDFRISLAVIPSAI